MGSRRKKGRSHVHVDLPSELATFIDTKTTIPQIEATLSTWRRQGSGPVRQTADMLLQRFGAIRRKNGNRTDYLDAIRVVIGRPLEERPPEQPIQKPILLAPIDPYYQTPAWRELLMETRLRGLGSCFYCGSGNGCQADHVIPRKKGGPDHLDNLVCCCPDCNKIAGNAVFPDRESKKRWILSERGRGRRSA